MGRLNVEAEYRAMTQGICELTWLLVLKDLGIHNNKAINLYCDNKAAINVVHYLMQYDRKKHIEIDRYFIEEKLS